MKYDTNYNIEWLDHDDLRACSIILPVELFTTHNKKRWLSFLDDIMPSGDARKRWVGLLGLLDRSPPEQDYELLKFGAMAPIGNMRIRESVEHAGSGVPTQFTIADIEEHNSRFIDYALSSGSQVGCSLGAGGEAPKLLLRLSDLGEVWFDKPLGNKFSQDAHYLVKFPRGARNKIDCDILRAEYHFYHELELLGMSTISTDGMKLVDTGKYPSLFLPRFDVKFVDGDIYRCGLESVYSILEELPGSMLSHFDVVRRLVNIINSSHTVMELGLSFDVAGFVIDWVKRDLINICYGNSDNHGRNHSLIKDEKGIRLSPIYDFAPMKADPSAIARCIQWGAPFEVGGEYDWQAICEALSDYIDPELLLAELRALAAQIVGLEERLRVRGVPDSIIDMPVLAYSYLERKLTRWRLI